MRIWICDDNRDSITQLTDVLEKLHQKDIRTFTDPNELIRALREQNGKPSPDVIFLDIDFNGETEGFDASKEIHDINKGIAVIFITAYSHEFAQQVLLKSDHPFGYLTKPVSLDMVRQYLDKVANVQSEGKFLRCRFKGKDFLIKESSILFLESEKHVTIIMTSHGQYRVYEKISDILKRLSSDFIACHKSYVVNLNYVSKLQPNSLVLEDGEQIPISRSSRISVRENFYRHLQDKLDQDVQG